MTTAVGTNAERIVELQIISILRATWIFFFLQGATQKSEFCVSH
jgi:hypothetical protein